MEEELVKQEKLLLFTPAKSIIILCRNKVINIEFADIIYIVKTQRGSMIITLTRRYSTNQHLLDLLKELPANEFFQLSRSHIAALQFMDGMERGRMKVGGYYLPLLSYYKREICKRLAQLLDRNYNLLTKI